MSRYLFHYYFIAGDFYDTNGNQLRDEECMSIINKIIDDLKTGIKHESIDSNIKKLFADGAYYITFTAPKITCKNIVKAALYSDKSTNLYYNEYIGEKCTRLDYSNDVDEIHKHIVAMVNSEYGGDIYVGVENGMVCGALNIKQEIISKAFLNIPQVDKFWTIETIDIYATTEISDKIYVGANKVCEIYKISVANRTSLENINYYEYKGVRYTRQGGKTVVMNAKYENVRAPHTKYILHNKLNESYKKHFVSVLKPVEIKTTAETLADAPLDIITKLKMLSGNTELIKMCVDILKGHVLH